MGKHEKAGPLTHEEQRELDKLQKKLERAGKVLPPHQDPGKHAKKD